MRSLIFILLTIYFLPVLSQEKGSSLAGDSTMMMLRAYSTGGDWKAAENLALEILTEDPGNTDLRLYLARLYAWQTEFDSAFAVLNRVLCEDTLLTEGISLKCDILFWQNDWSSLSNCSEKALEHLPGDSTMIYYRALSEYQLGRRFEALNILDSLLVTNPGDVRAKNLKSDILLNTDKPEVFVQYFYDHFNDPFRRRWHMLTFGSLIPYSRGSVSPYINAGHLIDEGSTFIQSSAIQFNVDAYLLFTRSTYLLAGYGISNGSYMAKHRAILNVWQVLPQGWSLSAGARYFYWEQHLLFYNLGVEKYIGNYWFTLNNYLFFKAYGPSVSTYLSARRYLENKYNYLSATIGYGTSPDEPITAATDLERLNAISVRLGLMRQLGDNIRINAGVGYMYEEYFNKVYRNRYEARIGLFYKID